MPWLALKISCYFLTNQKFSRISRLFPCFWVFHLQMTGWGRGYLFIFFGSPSKVRVKSEGRLWGFFAHLRAARRVGYRNCFEAQEISLPETFLWPFTQSSRTRDKPLRTPAWEARTKRAWNFSPINIMGEQITLKIVFLLVYRIQNSTHWKVWGVNFGISFIFRQSTC